MDKAVNYLVNNYLIETRLSRACYKDKIYPIEPRVMDVLSVLIENAGELLSRDEIIARVWKNRAVSENSLNRNIGEIRKLLDKHSGQPSCIKTIPKKGYLFQANVQIIETNNQSSLPIDWLDYSDNQKAPTEIPRSVANSSVKTEATQSLIKKRLKPAILLSIIALVLTGYFIVQQKSAESISSATNAQKQNEKPQLSSSSINYKVAHNVTLSPIETTKAFCLDGIDDYFEVDNPSIIDIGTGDFSMSAWIKTQAEGTVVIVDKRDESMAGDVRGFNLHLYKGFVGVQLADGKGDWHCKPDPTVSSCTNYNSSAFVADNQWHFITVTIDRDNSKGINFFVDGNFVQSHNPTNRSGSLSTPSLLRVGSRSSSTSALFPGVIGEVKIYNYLLTSNEIETQYSKGIKRSCDAR